jgi:DnaJ-class molecular chaperone
MTAAVGGSEQLRLSASGDVGEGQTITVKIPPGIENGAKLRVKGRGTPGSKGGVAGDIILTVLIGQHPYFRRESLDLLVDVPITIAEAVQGVSVRLPLLNGTAQMKIPPGAASGKRLRIKGKGITDAKGNAGDFYAIIQIVAPPADDLSSEANKALQEVASELQNPRESAPWADDVRDRSA